MAMTASATATTRALRISPGPVGSSTVRQAFPARRPRTD